MSFYGSPVKRSLGVNFIKNENYIELENELKMKSLYLAKSAHELKNVFLTISSFIENNGNSFNAESPNAKRTSFIDDDLANKSFLKALCDYGMSLIYEITQMSKNDGQFISIKSNKIEPFNLYDSLYFCIHIFESRAKFERKTIQIKFNFKLSKETTIKSISELRLKQVVINLLSNSFKFTIKGYIIVSVERIEGKIRITISDTGIGFNLNENKNLFNPFQMIEKNQHLNKNGSGLGLHICKEILETHKSKINVLSKKGKGSQFWFDINDDEEEIINPSLIINDSLKSIIFSINQGEKDLNQVFKTEDLKTFKNEEEEIKKECKSNVDDLSSYNQHLGPFRKVQTLNNFPIIKNNLKHSTLENRSSNTILKSRNYKKIKKLNIAKTLINLGISGNFNRSYSKIEIDAYQKEFFKNKSNIKCLICDDDSFAALSIRKLILKYFKNDEKNIPDIFYVPNGIECLHMVYTNLLHNNPINIIIMDQNMPFLNGFFTCKIIKSIQEMNDIKIYLQSSELININECHANGFYDKPLSMNSIKDIFKKK